ncbi:hypothetical protein KIN20_001596 [Parelaphostrongylus tenuis]|uniref:Uncharacterized protein n=1 Tax=Parelaphostrongylus tenuis TaxID=148309 RepID=A0AAD5QCR1_PARTN|nr:hypothetical protein KIN20_001596 [Parelaphostrongylus tenuis]
MDVFPMLGQSLTVNPKSEQKPQHHSHGNFESSTAEPEPAIKFDNIKTEDYGDVVELKNQPDDLDTEVIEQLVDRFLNTGSLANKNAPKSANPVAQALVGSSSYWNTDGLEAPGSIKDEATVRKWIQGYQTEAQKVLSRFVRSTSMQAKQFDANSIQDADLKRQLAYVSFEGMSALSSSDYADFSQAQNSLNRVASDVTICDKDLPPPCTLKKIDLESIFRTEKDASRLSHLWISYLTELSREKPTYQKLIELTNKGAKLKRISRRRINVEKCFRFVRKKCSSSF